MKKNNKYTHLIILLLVGAITLQAQQLTNVHFEQAGKEINIYYDLSGTSDNQQFDIQVFCSTDGGNTWGKSLQKVTGNVGKNQVAGYGRKVTWDVLADLDKLTGNVMFMVKAIPETILDIEMVFVKGGTFKMGCTNEQSNCYHDEKPAHTETVNDFYLSKYELTHKQYIEFLNAMDVNANGSYQGKEYIDMDEEYCAVGYNGKFYFKGSKYACSENCPIIYVTWHGAAAYCKWADGRLPTEAEWEYAARGGNQSRGYRYAGSNNIDNVAWYSSNSVSKSHLVGQKQPNELGIYDMSGNDWEWCSDRLYDYDSEGSSLLVEWYSIHGGSWMFEACACRVSNFVRYPPYVSNLDIGFRLAQDYTNTQEPINYANKQQPFKSRSNQGYVNITKEPPKPPYLEIVKSSLTFSDADGNQMIDANEQTKILFQLKNSGTGPGLNLTVKIEETNAAKGLSFSSSKSIGTLQPNTSIEVEIPVSGTMSTLDGKAIFSIAIAEANGFGTDPVIIEFPTRAFVAPQIKIVDYKVTCQAGTTIQKKRPFEVQVLVQNIGHGAAENITLVLPVPANMYCLSGNENNRIDKLSPGESKLVEYSLVTTNEYYQNDIRLDFQLRENYGKYAESKNIAINMNQQVSSEKLVIQGKPQEQKQIEIGSLSSAVDKDIPYNPIKNPNRIALIIGNEDYSGTLNAEANVPFAHNDALVFKQYAVNIMGVDEEKNLFFLTDATAAKMRINIDLVTRLVEKMGSSTELVFYYAGHGYPDLTTKTPYLIPVDAGTGNLRDAVKLAEVYEKFGNSGAKRITVFLDACFSGGSRNQESSGARPIKIKPKVESITGNMVVFSASSGEQSSLPYNSEKHGLFTYFLLKKLQDTKGIVTYDELAEYLKHNISVESLRANKREQDPEVNTSPAVQNNWKMWKINE